MDATPRDVELKGTVREPVELFITEVAAPSDELNAKFVEIYNAGVVAIDFDSEDFFFSTEFNGGTSINGPHQLTGNTSAKILLCNFLIYFKRKS